MSVEEDIKQLADASLLTERQAEAFVLRDVEAVPREAAAEWMGVSVNVLDKHLRAARDKAQAAQATVDAIENIRHEDLPTECGDCGTTLGGRWSKDGDGNAICLECADVEA